MHELQTTTHIINLQCSTTQQYRVQNKEQLC